MALRASLLSWPLSRLRGHLSTGAGLSLDRWLAAWSPLRKYPSSRVGGLLSPLSCPDISFSRPVCLASAKLCERASRELISFRLGWEGARRVDPPDLSTRKQHAPSPPQVCTRVNNTHLHLCLRLHLLTSPELNNAHQLHGQEQGQVHGQVHGLAHPSP